MFPSFLAASPSRENLLKFPHLAAIQHNNCMYLAHHLLTLGHHFRAHLPPPISEGVATFVDMVPGFRKLGKQIFPDTIVHTYKALSHRSAFPTKVHLNLVNENSLVLMN